MWYIAHADPGAKIYAGLKPGATRADFETALQNGTVADVVHVIEARTGDCLFIPSGRVHAIGAGLLIYEIQQNSDTTYRVFDWNRVGLDGKPRALHVQESMQSIDFTDFAPGVQQVQSNGTLVNCEYFNVKVLSGSKQAGVPGESLTIAAAQHQVAGVRRRAQRLGGTTLKGGDFALVPATLDSSARLVKLADAESHWLEIRVPA